MDDFARFCARELDGLARYATGLTGDRQAAHDLLADTLLAARLRWNRVDAADSPLAYVRRMVTNRFISQRRSWTARHVRLTRDGQLPDPGVPDPASAVDDRQVLIVLLAELPATQRAAVVMRYLLDLPDREIAAALGCSPVTVRSHISQALAALRITAAQGNQSRR